MEPWGSTNGPIPSSPGYNGREWNDKNLINKLALKETGDILSFPTLPLEVIKSQTLRWSSTSILT